MVWFQEVRVVKFDIGVKQVDFITTVLGVCADIGDLARDKTSIEEKLLVGLVCNE